MAVNPNFLVVGCQRCGTTWLDAALREHPEVYLPTKKQSYFFDRNYESGIERYLLNFKFTNDKHYKAVGEVATGYCLTDTIPKMHKHLPDAKLIMIMRNPIERAYSNYLIRKDEEEWSDFKSALDSSPDLISRGMYFQQIQELLKFYRREDILFLLYDELSESNNNTIQKVFSFLEIDKAFKPSILGKRKNSALFPTVRKILHKLGLKPMLVKLSSTFFGDIIRSVAMKAKPRGNMDAIDKEIAVELNEVFQASNHNVLSMLGRNPNLWDVK
jgi:hypothetical protein